MKIVDNSVETNTIWMEIYNNSVENVKIPKKKMAYFLYEKWPTPIESFTYESTTPLYPPPSCTR